MANKPTARSIAHLQTLYSVVAGLSLTIAITNTIDRASDIPIRIETIPYFVAFLFTLVPFYHGALRHLDVTYIENPNASIKPGALMADWGFLFLESCFFLAMASLLQKPIAFCYSLVTILAFDMLWGFVAYLAFSPKSSKMIAEVKWAIINLSCVVSLTLVLVYLDSVDSTQKPVPTYRFVLTLLIAIARTIWDYSWCWYYYYPNGSGQREANPT